MNELLERPAAKSPAALSAADSAKIRALVHHLANSCIEPDPDRCIGPSVPWNPTSSVRVRAVELGVVLVVMAGLACATLTVLWML